MPYVLIDQDCQIYYETNGEGVPIVFIHPPALGLVSFNKQKPLAEKYKLITFDIRGNGKSSFSNKKITIPLLAQDLKRLLEELLIDEAVLCSYSNGASIALEFALTYPNHTKALILASGFSEVSSFLLAQQFRVGLMTARLKGIKLLAKIFALSHTGEKAFQREIYEYVLRVNPQILYEMYKVGFTYNCTNRLSEIKKPVLLVYGRQDRYLHKYCKIFEKKLRNFETVMVNQSKHQVPTKHFREFNKIIDQFLQNLPLNSG